MIDEECIHLQITGSSVFVNPSYPIKEHPCSFKHGWDMNIQYNEVNGISSQSLSEKKQQKKKQKNGNIPTGMQVTITHFHILFSSISFDRLS